jgi:hypothetical protein
VIAGLHGNGMIENLMEVIESYEETFDRLIRETWSGGSSVVAQEEDEAWNSRFMRSARARTKQGMRVVRMPGEKVIGMLPSRYDEG